MHRCWLTNNILYDFLLTHCIGHFRLTLDIFIRIYSAFFLYLKFIYVYVNLMILNVLLTILYLKFIYVYVNLMISNVLRILLFFKKRHHSLLKKIHHNNLKKRHIGLLRLNLIVIQFNIILKKILSFR